MGQVSQAKPQYAVIVFIAGYLPPFGTAQSVHEDVAIALAAARMIVSERQAALFWLSGDRGRLPVVSREFCLNWLRIPKGG